MNPKKYIFLIPILCICYTVNLFAFAENKIDPAERALQIKEHLEIASDNIRFDVSKAHENAIKARSLSSGFDEISNIVADLYIAQIQQQGGEFDSSKIIIQQAIQRTKELKNDSLQGIATHYLGLHYQYKGSRELAIASYHDALAINEKIGAHNQSIRQLNNIGLIYRDEGDYEKAIEYLEKSIVLSKKVGNGRLEALSYGNIGYILLKQDKPDKAYERFKEVIQLSKEYRDSISLCTGYYLLADAELKKGNYIASKESADIAFDLSQKTNYIIGKIYSLRVKSDALRLDNKFKEAKEVALEAQRLVKKHSSNFYYDDVLEVLYNIEYDTGNFKEAIAVKDKIHSRKDSLVNINTAEKIANSESQYQLLKNEQEKVLLTIKNDNTKRNSYLLLAIAALLGLLGGAIYIALRSSQKYNESLEIAIEKRTNELQESNKELERFTYITAHDLKEPARNIISYSSLLNKRLKEKNYKSLELYSSIISKNTTQLFYLIDSILKFSDVNQRDEIVHEDIDLKVVIDEIKNLLLDTLQKRNIELSYTDLPTIKGDKSLLIILFKNLIENAIKFNSNENIKIEIGSDPLPKGHKLFVKDNGIGLEDEYKEQIFEMFKKLHPRSEFDGSGLGLSICKRIANLHGYDIGVNSEKGLGSTFYLHPIAA